MAEEIENRVAKSGLIQFDLETLIPQFETIDLKDWLKEGLVLIEKEFRAAVKEHDFSQYKDKIVFITCTTDAILPSWSYMLLTTALSSYTHKIYAGGKNLAVSQMIIDELKNINSQDFQDKRVIVKGCGNYQITDQVYIACVQAFKPIVKSLMFGEACSSVPVFKK